MAGADSWPAHDRLPLAATGADRAAVFMAGGIFSGAAADRRRHQPDDERGCDPALRAADRFRCAGGWARRREQPDRRELPPARRGLPENLYALARLCRVDNDAVPADRVSDGAGDRACIRELARAVAVSGGAAVLDQLPDPGLCLDRLVAAERPDQSRAARSGADRSADPVALQFFFGAARAGLFVSAIHDPAALWQPVA